MSPNVKCPFSVLRFSVFEERISVLGRINSTLLAGDRADHVVHDVFEVSPFARCYLLPCARRMGSCSI